MNMFCGSNGWTKFGDWINGLEITSGKTSLTSSFGFVGSGFEGSFVVGLNALREGLLVGGGWVAKSKLLSTSPYHPLYLEGL